MHPPIRLRRRSTRASLRARHVICVQLPAPAPSSIAAPSRRLQPDLCGVCRDAGKRPPIRLRLSVPCALQVWSARVTHRPHLVISCGPWSVPLSSCVHPVTCLSCIAVRTRASCLVVGPAFRSSCLALVALSSQSAREPLGLLLVPRALRFAPCALRFMFCDRRPGLTVGFSCPASSACCPWLVSRASCPRSCLASCARGPRVRLASRSSCLAVRFPSLSAFSYASHPCLCVPHLVCGDRCLCLLSTSRFSCLASLPCGPCVRLASHSLFYGSSLSCLAIRARGSCLVPCASSTLVPHALWLVPCVSRFAGRSLRPAPLPCVPPPSCLVIRTRPLCEHRRAICDNPWFGAHARATRCNQMPAAKNNPLLTGKNLSRNLPGR